MSKGMKMTQEQVTSAVIMVRPVAFRMNEQTAVNNYFQEKLSLDDTDINRIAQQEFDAFAKVLTDAGIHVLVLDDDEKSSSPDSIFPNNWVSTHANGNVAVYPMYAENRRKERRDAFFIKLEEEGYVINNIVDYTAAEGEGVFLEGTGSIVLDRANEKAYCALSPRADEALFIEFCEDFGYFPVIFTANQTVDGKRLPIFHTNVMMCVAEEFCVICLDTIDDKKERKLVVEHLKDSNKQIITITEEQMDHFSGNMLQLRNDAGDDFLVMSKAAHESLNEGQVQSIEKHCKILSSDLHIIESCGGGSARCMMAEVFLPKK